MDKYAIISTYKFVSWLKYFSFGNKIYQNLGKAIASMETPTAFVIEDDRNLALAFAEAVKEADFEVEVFYDGQTALDRLAEATPNIVILDLHIPHVSGSQILDYIRSTERLKSIRVIVASADDHRAAELRGVADLVLLKPIGFRQLQQLATRLRPR